jgi:hypothetical protein
MMAGLLLNILCRFPVARLAWAAIMLALSVLRSGAATALDYTGHYELAAADVHRHFYLDVHQQEHRADVSFVTAATDADAPDGSGKGQISNAGILSFKFRDSFNNEGTCTLQPQGSIYHLSMVVTKIVQPKPLHFYGDVVLRKVARY